MLHTWRAIIKSSELISTITEIFIAEPTVDWSRRKVQHQDDTAMGTTKMLEGNEKELPVQLLLGKIKGENPLAIIRKLLQINGSFKKPVYADNWKKVVLDGRESVNAKQFLDDEELIDTLISLASDKSVLGRAYVGWSAWV